MSHWLFRTLVGVALAAATVGSAQGTAYAACPGAKSPSPATRAVAVNPEVARTMIELWLVARRTPLRGMPDRVLVADRDNDSVAVRYERQGCTLAVLEVERDRLWSFLRKRLGPAA